MGTKPKPPGYSPVRDFVAHFWREERDEIEPMAGFLLVFLVIAAFGLIAGRELSRPLEFIALSVAVFWFVVVRKPRPFHPPWRRRSDENEGEGERPTHRIV